MRFNYDNYPALKFLKDGNWDNLSLHVEDRENKGVVDHTIKMIEFKKDKLLGNIEYITKPFLSAITSCYEKINKQDIGNIKRTGTIIYEKITMFYCIDAGDRTLNKVELYTFDGDTLIQSISTNPDNEILYWDSEALDKKGMGVHEFSASCTNNLLTILFFIKNAEIQIKEVKALSQVKDINCKYTNETKSDIKVLDSTWFTTLVRSEEFKVRGHFRLQPYGVGMTEKKLIWIADFKKDGYTRNFKRPVLID